MTDVRKAHCAVSMFVVMIVAFAVAGTAFAGSFTIDPQNKACWRDYHKYKKWGLHKAFVLTTRYAKLQSCASAYGYSSKKDAIGKALTLCRAEAKRNKVRGTCHLLTSE